jgi:hypothetical protein
MRGPARWDAKLPAQGIVLCLLGLLAAIIGAGLLGRVQPVVGLAAAGSLFAGTALLFPRLGLALLVMVAPIQGLWGLSRQDMPVLLGVLMLAVNLRHLDAWWRLRHLTLWPRHGRHGETLPLLLTALAAFIALYLLRGLPALPDMPEAQLRAAVREAAFLILLFGAALATARHCADENGDALRLGLIGAVALALMLTLSFDVVAVYFPAFSRDLHLLPEWQGVRLAGLHANPNATAKFLVAGEAFALAAYWRLSGLDGEPPPDVDGRWPLLALALAMAAAIAIGATLSKASLLGAIAAPMVMAMAFWHTRRRRRRRRAVLAAVLSAVAVLVLALGFDAVLATSLHKQTQERRMEAEHIQPPPPPPAPSAPAAAKPQNQAGVVERIGRELRIGQSHEMVVQAKPTDTQPVQHSEMYRNIEGNIEYKVRDCAGLGCTGQRDRLWKTGLQVWAEHWLVGIGPAAWPGEYLRRLQFPFDTPHNVLIELGGGFGLAGVAVYALLSLAMLRALPLVFGRCSGDTAATVYARGTLLFAWAILITEWVDPAKFFTMSPHALWLWPLLAGATALDFE